MTKDFYFSYTYDITHTLQYNMNRKNQIRENYNRMFMWNRFLSKELEEVPGLKGKKVNPWVIPVIHGYFIQARILTMIDFFFL